MPNITADLSIANGAAVAKTFNIVQVSPDDSLFVEKTNSVNGTPTGFTRLRVRSSAPTATRATYIAKIDVDHPKVATVDGVDKQVYSCGFRGEFFIPAAATQTDRDNLVAYVINALNHASVKPVIQSLSPMF